MDAVPDAYLGAFIAFCVLFAVTLIGFVVLCYLYMAAKNAGSADVGSTEMASKANSA